MNKFNYLNTRFYTRIVDKVELLLSIRLQSTSIARKGIEL